MLIPDLTIIFITANEVPEKWAEYHRQVLKETIGDLPVITISRKPMGFGLNLIDTEPKSISNIYWQLLRGAKEAKTPFIAVVEDDTLYTKEHFQFRPQPDAFAYNMSRLNLFTWGKPTYFLKNRVSNSVLIAPRQLAIEALEERFQRHPVGSANSITGELGRVSIAAALGVKPYKLVEFYSEIPVVRFDHDFGHDHAARRHTKKMGIIQAYDIPYWGPADELVKKFT